MSSDRIDPPVDSARPAGADALAEPAQAAPREMAVSGGPSARSPDPAPAAPNPEERFRAFIMATSDTVYLMNAEARRRSRRPARAVPTPSCSTSSLPKLSGYEVARRLRDDPSLGSVMLIAMTGYGQAQDRRRSQDAGFDAHLVKPVEFADLVGTLEQLVDRRAGAWLAGDPP